MYFVKNKKQNKVVFVFVLFLFLSGVFLFAPAPAHAGWFSDTWDTIRGAAGAVGDATINAALWPIKAILYYAVFVPIGWMTSAALILFEWSINPDYISGRGGILNRVSIYESWKFIRDFFNLFFILTLLYIAFTIVFQVAKDYKKTLLSLALAALFVNFSFPITRVIIDATNVPMYYFVNQMAADSGGRSVLGNYLTASQIKEMIIRSDQSINSTSLEHLIMAIIFLFIFTITLGTLSVLMMVRLVALIILLIFSAVGFAASVIPGLGKYSTMWWEKLWQYALFGPAAMLMLFIALRFFAEISRDNTRVQFFQVGLTNATKENAGILSAMAMFSIPIIMLWMAIGLASSFSVAGAGAIEGTGKRFAKWAGKKTYNNSLGRGLYGGAKKTAMEGKLFGLNYGKRAKFLTGDYWAKPSKLEAGLKGGMAGGRSGARTELDKLHQQQVNKKAKENKENQVNRSNLLRDLESTNVVERQAAALTLAENGEIRSTQDLTTALKAMASSVDEKGQSEYNESAADMAARVIDKAKDGAATGMTKEQYQKIAGNRAFYVKDKDGNIEERDGKPVANAALEALNSRLKKDGQVNARVEFEIDRKIEKMQDTGPVSDTQKVAARTEVYNDLIGKMSAEDLAKQKDIYDAPAFIEYAKSNMNSKRAQEVMNKATEKSNASIQRGWAAVALAVEAHGKNTTPAGLVVPQQTGGTPRSRTVFPSKS